MTRDHDIERVLERWFTEGPTQMPQPLPRRHARSHRPMPRSGASRVSRTEVPGMHAASRVAAAVAVVLVVAGVGAAILSRNDSVGRPSAGSGAVPTRTPGRVAPNRGPSAAVPVRHHQDLGWDIVVGQSVADDPGPRRRPQLGDGVGSDRSSFGPRPRFRVLALPGRRSRDVLVRPLAGSSATDADAAERCVRRPGDRPLGRLVPDGPRGSCSRVVTTRPRFRPFGYGTTGHLTYTVPTGWVGTLDERWPLRPCAAGDLGRRGGQPDPECLRLGSGSALQREPRCGRRRPDTRRACSMAPDHPGAQCFDPRAGHDRRPQRCHGRPCRWRRVRRLQCGPGLYTFALSGSDDGGWSSRLLVERHRAGEIRPAGSRRRIRAGHRDPRPVERLGCLPGDADVLVDGFEFTR